MTKKIIDSNSARNLFEEQIENDLEIRLKLKDDIYAQNLYAALCNIQWIYKDVFELIKREKFATYSWRGAGELIARLRDQGETYLDYYFSGMFFDDYEDGLQRYQKTGFVREGVVTEEIRQDLDRLGWIPLEYDEDE